MKRKTISSVFFQAALKPMLLINFTARMALYVRIFDILTRKFGSVSLQRFAMFKTKRFFFTFRPISKGKDMINFRKRMDNDNFRKMIEHMQSLIIKQEMAKIPIVVLKRQVEDKKTKPFGGILAILGPSEFEVSYVGSNSITYKDYCGYNIEKSRFQHRGENEYHNISDEMFESSQFDQDYFVSSGYASEDSYENNSSLGSVSLYEQDSRIHKEKDKLNNFI